MTSEFTCRRFVYQVASGSCCGSKCHVGLFGVPGSYIIVSLLSELERKLQPSLDISITIVPNPNFARTRNFNYNRAQILTSSRIFDIIFTVLVVLGGCPRRRHTTKIG
jgi:hypothetical protein